MTAETVILLVFGVPFLLLCLIYAVCSANRQGRAGRKESAARTPRIYISQQVPSVFDAFRRRDDH